jgi:hypothetical protein
MTDMLTRRQAIAAAAVTLTLLPLTLRAQPAPLPDKPFAEHRIVLQSSDDDSKKQSLVLSVANNLIKAYGPDKIAIEVVAPYDEVVGHAGAIVRSRDGLLEGGFDPRSDGGVSAY